MFEIGQGRGDIAQAEVKQAAIAVLLGSGGIDEDQAFAHREGSSQLPSPPVDCLEVGEEPADDRTGRRRAEERVREALAAGKLVEAQRAWAEELLLRDEESFDEWLRTAPVVVLPGATRPPAGGDPSTRRDRAVTSRARAEFRASRLLAGLTTEEAFVADALRRMQRERGDSQTEYMNA